MGVLTRAGVVAGLVLGSACVPEPDGSGLFDAQQVGLVDAGGDGSGSPGEVNAEVVLGTVTNLREGAQWLGYTYMAQRMARNPLAVDISVLGLPELERKMRRLEPKVQKKVVRQALRKSAKRTPRPPPRIRRWRTR